MIEMNILSGKQLKNTGYILSAGKKIFLIAGYLSKYIG